MKSLLRTTVILLELHPVVTKILRFSIKMKCQELHGQAESCPFFTRFFSSSASSPPSQTLPHVQHVRGGVWVLSWVQKGEDTTEPAKDATVDGLTDEVMPLGKGHKRAAIVSSISKPSKRSFSAIVGVSH